MITPEQLEALKVGDTIWSDDPITQQPQPYTITLIQLTPRRLFWTDTWPWLDLEVQAAFSLTAEEAMEDARRDSD